MTPPLRSTFSVSIEKLAPTGEGLVRTNEGVGLVEGALPGEEVDVEVLRVSRKIWWGRAVAIRRASPDRVSGPSGGHADGCPACDWAHFELSAARRAKRDLFLETMERIGRVPARVFTDLGGGVEVEASPAGYRIRSRLHAQARAGEIRVGAFAPRSHGVEPLERCEALGAELQAVLPKLARALSPEAVPIEIAVLEGLDGIRRLARFVLPADARRGGNAAATAARLAAAVRPLFAGARVIDPSGRILHASGERRLWLSIAGRDVPAAPDAFFQGNRFLVEPLVRHVASLAAAVPAGTALDAYGGSGLFAGALLDAGHAVTSVEGNADAVENARLARERWGFGKANAVADGRDSAGTWRIERAPVLEFAARDPGREDVIVVDPPRAGLGLPLAAAIARRARKRIVYVSCDPATLARDLSVFREHGWEVADARLYDLFAFTHRVEAVLALVPSPSQAA